MRISHIIQLLEEDGWFIVVCRGSYRQYKHRVRPGRITISGKLSHYVTPGKP